MNFKDLLLENQKFKKIAKNINSSAQSISGLSGSRISYFAVNFLKKAEKDIVFFLPDNYYLQQMQEDLIRLIGKDEFLVFPEEEILPHEQLMPDLTTMSERTKVLTELLFSIDQKKKIILTTPAAVFKKLPPRDIYQKKSINIKTGSEVNIDQLRRQLFALGYKKEEMVEAPGQYSIRGGIIDVFTLLDEQPFRIELFGDEVDSIRKIDLTAQRSKKEVSKITIPPFANLVIDEDVVNRAYPKLEAAYSKAVAKLMENNYQEEASYLREKAKKMLEDLKEKHRFPGFEQFLPFYYEETANFFDYLETSLVFAVRPNKMEQLTHDYYQEITETHTRLLEQGMVFPEYLDNFITENEFKKEINKNRVVDINSEFEDEQVAENDIHFNTSSLEPFHGQLELFSDKIMELLQKKYRIAITLNSASKKRRVKMFLEEKNIVVGDNFDESRIVIFPDSLAEGFIFDDIKLAVFSDKEVFGNEQKRKRKIGDFEEGVEISSIDDLKAGNYVVHENHGIGKYLGVKTLEIQGQHKDYLVLKYAGEDKLYVPTEKIHLVQKYIGSDAGNPKLYKLGSSDWKKVKEKVQKSVEEMAVGLLELYAERETLTGYQFSEDDVWQQEFEDAFPFEETPDQKEAIQDVKSDMESEKPMDRLLCGDVGYGKTEVAIRAAFKAALDSKQTAVLVPTTILAQQHYNTFSERVEEFPVRVGMLSRFNTAAEQRKTLKRLIKGDIDILIGTHRLLSKDVIFDDLGLLIIDEEQRFGVTHKEKLKNLKRNVDVLTLTATPIPRTLHMALVGVRDMSLIETPPENRYPIRTFIKEHNKELIASAIRRELAREGQIYFVHNRVKDIEKTAGKLQKLMPEAKIAVAHGQMNEKRLEKIMYDFYHHKFDILVCTTIIETGLDIPNVNTIIINHADKMGLSQLYQLRGRVGRTNRIAYAYLLYERDRILPEVAEKRLEAIKEFSSLGSGFKIAMRDLEIRGAGNLLGPEQSGHIAAVGFSLYTKLLEGTIEELKGKSDQEKIEVEIDLSLDAYIPDDYIKYEARKIEIYKKIKSIEKEEDALDTIDELIDRFGEPPVEVMRLVNTARLKFIAAELNIELIKEDSGKIKCQFLSPEVVDGSKLVEFSKKYRRKTKIKSAKKPLMLIKIDDPEDIDKQLLKMLKDLKNI
ncbi:transcription-repair coupling factor [Halanaerobium saccharolyticum]|uniref:Transcription-repair-coupling factor n=1 Tax=Halanaerobium saccharolyticum TaxID=43595 RepID=A0A4R7YYB1_9FIRM|nr:transcription-repair coupling factor [Halanaerobium saccharolyticum]RAK06611.1 transcription-repair coupling factor [Halanaerobium saccharolyticum]TDW01150.1 transcription-repair coupling factor [Halanaerobium saccharolyticum]TDX51201.1 transcription-repair coupling factor [Halanaerobium saccharolyticum]